MKKLPNIENFRSEYTFSLTKSIRHNTQMLRCAQHDIRKVSVSLRAADYKAPDPLLKKYSSTNLTPHLPPQPAR
jgi:hypothetical protein